MDGGAVGRRSRAKPLPISSEIHPRAQKGPEHLVAGRWHNLDTAALPVKSSNPTVFFGHPRRWGVGQKPDVTFCPWRCMTIHWLFAFFKTPSPREGGLLHRCALETRGQPGLAIEFGLFEIIRAAQLCALFIEPRFGPHQPNHTQHTKTQNAPHKRKWFNDRPSPRANVYGISSDSFRCRRSAPVRPPEVACRPRPGG